MNFAFSEEQEEFRETLRRFFEERASSLDVRRTMETREGFDAALWKQMGEELGLQGVGIPEAYGGQGFGFLELAIVQEEMGRVLFPAPYFGSIGLAANAILNAGSEDQKRALLPGIASGETIGSLALLEGKGGWDAAQIGLEFRPDGDSVRITGAKELVVDAPCANLWIVAGRSPGSKGEQGIGLAVVRGDDPGVRVAPCDSLDLTRKLGRVEFADSRGEVMAGAGNDAAKALEKTLRQASTLLAAECAGGAARCLEMAVAYAKTRHQFARPIGSFQAIKHKCAEMLLEVETAKSGAYYAAWAASEDDAELAIASSMAKACCAEAFLQTSTENIQIHGGIGFTWEHDAHLYYRRAKSNEMLLGSPGTHRAQLATELGF